MKYRSILLFTSFLISSVVFSQNILRGTVKDDLSNPIPDVNLVIQNTNYYATTNYDGKYSIYNIPDGAYKLVVSMIGFSEKEILINLSNSQTLRQDLILDEGVKLDEVIINARIAGQANALNTQKNRGNMVSIISKEQIERFPDANIGDALKRIAGINVQYDQGEARFANIRGTAPELNSVTINGERIPSAEGDKRSVQLDLIPADMIETIELNKAITPDMDADAIGGSINLITKKAPSKQRIKGTIGSGYSVLAEKLLYKGKLSYSNRFKDDKIGLILSVSVLDKQIRSDNVEAEWDYTDENQTAHTAFTSDMQIRKYLLQRLRQSYGATIDFDLNSNNNIYISTSYNWRNDWENRFRLRYKDIEEDAGQLKAEIRRQTKAGTKDNKYKRLEDQRVLNLGVGGKHQIDKFHFKWTISKNKASEERPNERYISYRNKDEPISLDLTNLNQPQITPLNADVQDFSNAFSLKEISEEFKYTEEEDLNIRFDFELPILTGKNSSSIKFGTKYKDKAKVRENTFREYEPLDETSFNADAFQNGSSQTNTGFNAGNYQIGSFVTPEFIGNLNLLDESLFESETVLEELAGNFKAREQVSSFYTMYTQNLSAKLMIIAGMRYEKTDLAYQGKIFDGENLTDTEQIKDTYENILPALHIKYKLSTNTNIRLAYTNSLARPNYYDIVPYQEIDTEDNLIKIGNPALEATTATNFDLLGEHFFKNVGIVSAGVFYKDLKNVIADKTLYDYMYNGNLYDKFTQPVNTGNASLLGFEVGLQSRLFFLPGFLKNLSVLTNYTYTNSKLTNISIEGRENEMLPLTGTPKNIINASLAYDTKKMDLRISYNFAANFIEEYSDEAFYDRWYDKVSYLDMNANYKISKHWKIYASANNLLNQPLRYYQGVRERVMQNEFYGIQTKIGVKFKF